jgi:hypothetical protein
MDSLCLVIDANDCNGGKLDPEEKRLILGTKGKED